MDSKLLIVKCITLLYRESELEHTSGSADLCRKVVETIRIPETSISMQSGREVIVGLRSTLNWMLDHNEKKYDRTQLLQRVRINTKDDTYLYNAVVDGIAHLEDEEEIKKQILNYRMELQDYLASQSINTIIAKAFNRINIFSDGQVDYRKFVREIYDELEPYTHNIVESRHPSVVDHVSFDNEEGVAEVLSRSKSEISAEGVLVTGWQGINRMLGQTGGIRRGEFVLVGALQHNFKTGFCLNLFKHLALYNIPYMRDSAKKPLLLHFSLENELTTNILWLYANLWENETGQACDINSIDVTEASRYIKERMQVNGYAIDMVRVDPNQCTYHDFADMILKYEAEGYEVHAIVCDYLAMMNKGGLDRSGPTGSEVRELFRRVRNFCAPRGIAFVTPHQLSTEAKMLTRQGVENFVQEIANKGYYDSSRTIDQEVDLEIMIHIEKIAGDGSYLTCQRGKHRGVQITPEKDLYCVLPFRDIGGILDDINGKDNTRNSVGGASVADGGAAWYDMAA